MTKNERQKVLQHFQDIAASIRIGVTSDIVNAAAQEQIEISDEQLPRLVSLVQTLIDTYSANGYEQLQRVIK